MLYQAGFLISNTTNRLLVEKKYILESIQVAHRMDGKPGKSGSVNRQEPKDLAPKSTAKVTPLKTTQCDCHWHPGHIQATSH